MVIVSLLAAAEEKFVKSPGVFDSIGLSHSADFISCTKILNLIIYPNNSKIQDFQQNPVCNELSQTKISRKAPGIEE